MSVSTLCGVCLQMLAWIGKVAKLRNISSQQVKVGGLAA